MKKMYDYFCKYGFVALIKKIRIHFSFYIRREYNIKNGIYIVKKKYKEHIFEKPKKITLYSVDLDKDFDKICKLNDLGYDIAIFTTDNNQKRVLPISKIEFKKNITDAELQNSNNKITEILTTNKSVKKIDLSIIVLNYNNMECIFKCVDSLIENNSYNYEIIIVDNQSVDGSYEKLLKVYNKNNVKIVRNVVNGCSSGRNLGVLQSNKEFVMFLDSDQFVKNKLWLDNYIDILNHVDNVGAIGWTGGWFNKKGIAQYTVESFLFRNMPPYGIYRNDLGYIGSGGMIMKRSIFNKIKGFDQMYDPTCYEDTDISLKIRNEGLELLYCPYLSVIHEAHKTTKSGSKEHSKLIEERGIYFKNKWKKTNKELLKYIK